MSDRGPSHGRLYLLLLLMVTFWSFNYVVGKVALREFAPLPLVALRTALAAVLLIPLFLWRGREPAQAWTWRELRVLIPLGVFGLAGNQCLFVLGLARTSVAHAAIVIGITPILVLLIAAAVGQERVSKGKVAGMAIAFAGLLVLQMGRAPGSQATLLGDGLALLGALAMAAFTVGSKSISHRYGGITVNTICYASGGLCFAPLLLFQDFHYSRVSVLGWCSVLYMAAFSSVLAYLIFYHAIRYVSASRVSVFQYLQPVLATLMAIPTLREPLHPGLVFGGSLALLGVFVTERS
ncbi:MAG: DMT family transporter [Acidobacteriaceae bacterium]|nr:DMT family transporter [Acidobacteriaceae bacterium]